MPAWHHEDRRSVQLARSLWFEVGAYLPTNVGAVAGHVGLDIEWMDDAPKSVRALLMEKAIFVNRLLLPTQQRYAVAHEIAHALLLAGKMHARHARQERVCQIFAASLLMPPDVIHARAQQLYGRADMFETLAWQFGVSTQALNIHLRRLGILDGKKGIAECEVAATAWCDEYLVRDIEEHPGPRGKYVPIYSIDIDRVYAASIVIE